MIEQPETKHEIKMPQLRNVARFNVRLLKGNSREAPARFFDVFRSSVEPARVQTTFRKRLGEKSNATTHIHRGRKSEGGLQSFHDAPKRLLASFNESAVFLPVKRRQLDGNFRGLA